MIDADFLCEAMIKFDEDIFLMILDRCIRQRIPIDIPLAACAKGWLKTVDKLVTVDQRTVDRRTRVEKVTPLAAACINGHVSVIKYLLENGADDPFCSFL